MTIFVSILLMAFQLLMQTFLFFMMKLENVYNEADSGQRDIYNGVHSTSGHIATADDYAGFLSSLGLAAALPPILESLGEVQLDTSSSEWVPGILWQTAQGGCMKLDHRNFGGGSGGGQLTTDHVQSFDGDYLLTANQVEILSAPPLPPAVPGPCLITIQADAMGIGGKVNVNGSQGVRISAGPPSLPPTASASTNGVEIAVGEIQNVTIQRGLLPGVDQKIEMTPSGITVDAGTMPITIQSLTQITLSVAGGLSTITLAPEGVTIQGVLVQIN